MSNPNLRVIAPDPQQHADELVELCAKTFNPYFDRRRDLRNWYLLNSTYDWKASAIGLVDGQMVTHYGVWDYQMRIGSAVVRCGGIGCVATHGEFRKQGLMAQTIPTSLNAMRQGGYDLTILFGVGDFYHRFNYVRAWNEVKWFINRDKLPAELPAVKTEIFDGTPREDIARLHNRQNATATGSAVRPTYAVHGYYFWPVEGRLWKDAKGKLAGHVVVSSGSGRLVCHESTGTADQVLAVLKQLAEEKQMREISIETAPYNSEVLRRVRQCDCRCEKTYIKSGLAMVQCLNLGPCLGKMTGELSRRLQGSELAGYTGELRITGCDATVGLKIAGGKVSLIGKAAGRNAIRGGHEVAQLLIGTDEPMEVCEAGKIRLSGDAARLVSVLFPNQHPQLHQLDRY